MPNSYPMTATRKITILEPPSGQNSNAEGEWMKSRRIFMPETLVDLPKQSYLFLRRSDYPPADGRREKLLEHFNVPAFVANQTCFEMNGFFGSRSAFDDEKRLTSHTTWFRILIKMIRKEADDPHDKEDEYATSSSKDYQWYETTVFTRWDRGPSPAANRCQVLVVDVPSDCPDKLLEVLRKQAGSSSPNFQDPFALHSILIDQLAAYCDISVRRIRDPVRHVEKTRMRTGAIFGAIHEISRHAIHASEVLEAGADTLKELQRCQVTVHDKMADVLGETYIQQAREYTQFQISLLKNLRLRADSNRERLKNEINLAFNNLTRQDNSVLKSIALLTMIFLPATFISALFSTTFFSYGDDGKGWQVSDKMWVYWATTIPATLFIIVCWRIWLTWGDAILNSFGVVQKWIKGVFTRLKPKKKTVLPHETF